MLEDTGKEQVLKETHWTKTQFEGKLAKAKGYAEENPLGFSFSLEQWCQPDNRQKRTIVEGVRDAFKDGGMDLQRSWTPGCNESCSIFLQAIPELGVSFAAIATDFNTHVGISKVHYGADHYDSQLGLMIALYRASYSYGKEKFDKCREILEKVDGRRVALAIRVCENKKD